MKSDVATSLSSAPADRTVAASAVVVSAPTQASIQAATAPAFDFVDQRRAAVAKLPDACPGHEHPAEETTTGLIELPSTLRHPSTAVGTKKMWRSIAELEDSQEFKDLLDREFPKAASEWTDEVSRRNFMKIMGASMALAGLTACWKRPDELVVPYVVPPEQVVPGKALYFATTYTMEGVGRGVIVESHEGRPTKIEGNPDHPGSRGAASAQMQASILTMYDPDRSQAPLRTGDNSSWDRFITEVLPRIEAMGATKGDGMRLLMTPTASPTVDRQLKQVLAKFPAAKIHTYDPAGHSGTKSGSQAAFGQDVNTVYKFDAAAIVLSLDSNFFVESNGTLRYSKDFINGRRVRQDNRKMNRLYVVETTPTITGAMADHRERVKPTQVEAFARALLARISGENAETTFPWLDAAARDLLANRGKSIVIPGDHASSAVMALAHQINAALGNVGQTLYYTDPVYSAVPSATMDELVADCGAGKVKLLFILGGNPAYDATPDLNFTDAIKDVDFKVRLGLYNDETSFLCHWHIPESHFLESWSDARAYDGTASIVQPLIAPLFTSVTVHRILSILTGQRDRTDNELVRDTWRPTAKGDFELWWREVLNKGIIDGTALPPRQVTARAVGNAPATQPAGGGIEVVFRNDPNVLDGRFANNGWLQELPKPLTKLTWDNVFYISPKQADKLGVPKTDKWDDAWGYNIEVTVNGKSVTGPAWVLPGHPDDVITAFLGYGRSRAGVIATNTGFSVSPLRTSASPWMATDATVTLKDGRLRLACTQTHQLMKGTSARDLIRVHPIADYEKAKYGPHGPEASHGGGHDDAHGEAHGGAHGDAADTGTGDHAVVGAAGAEAAHADTHTGTHGATTGATGESAFLQKHKSVPLTVYKSKMPSDPPYDPTTNQWAMSIDNNACIGCNACVVACVSENNIPIVGKEQVIFGREMHWLRIDTYYGGDSVEKAQGPYFQPLPCMHCESAPCEVVCPVEATQHDDEGLNVMTYNRCVGTKYCSNNCPYKVRRFNFFRYKDDEHETIKLMRNPNVSIRTRGIMEKCTYCTQRINAARIEVKTHGGEHGGTSVGKVVGDMTPLTACQQSCPTDAISFGNLTDPNAAVVSLKMEPTDYSLLAELNTRPRTTYMGRFTNPNPEIHG